MDEITLDDKVYVSSKRAAQITGYAKDYVGQLCREGRVHARLVGRNWYVLESSVRAHRFGVSEKLEESKNEESNNASVFENKYLGTWKPSSYASEEIPVLPTVHTKPFQSANASPAPTEAEFKHSSAPNPISLETLVEEVEDSLSTVASASSNVVEEMQSAWHDWFSRTHEAAIPEEILHENDSTSDLEWTTIASQESQEQVFESTHEEVPVHISRTHTQPSEDVPERTPEPISYINAEKEPTLHSDEEVIETEYSHDQSHASLMKEEYVEHVPLKRSYQTSKTAKTQSTQYYIPSRPSKLTHEIPEGRIIRERRVKNNKGTSGVAIRVLFISLAVLALLVALVGTGKLNTLFSQEHMNYSIINYLGGQSSVEKAK